jgi:hypothetical protein
MTPIRLLTLAVLGAAIALAARGQQPAPTPAEQHVVAPSLPDQQNKESTVRPSGAMQTDSAGWVVNGQGETDSKGASPKASRGAKPGVAAAPPAGPASFPPPPAAGSRGEPVVEAAHITLRGSMKAYEPGKSITIVEASGKSRTVPLSAKASVYEGIATGDKVAVRIPLQKPGDGKTADRVEKQKKTAPPKSKFSQAQSPAE